jgi:hypothetical protein
MTIDEIRAKISELEDAIFAIMHDAAAKFEQNGYDTDQVYQYGFGAANDVTRTMYNLTELENEIKHYLG